jgi:hypothetical protein
MTVNEIKDAVDKGKIVYWSNSNYEVIKDNRDQYLIKYNFNNTYIGLTWTDNTTLNGKEEDFYIKKEELLIHNYEGFKRDLYLLMDWEKQAGTSDKEFETLFLELCKDYGIGAFI